MLSEYKENFKAHIAAFADRTASGALPTVPGPQRQDAGRQGQEDAEDP